MSFPRYPEYKDSGVEWLGYVPRNWGLIRLKALVVEVDQRADGDDLELLGLSKSLGVVSRSELEQGASESDNYAKYKVVDAGHLVMNKMQAWNGVFGLSSRRGMTSPDYAVFRFIKTEYDKFLCSLFRTDLMAGVFFTRCRGMGTAFLRLNTPDFLDVKVPLPPIDEATEIVNILGRETAKMDALIAEQEQLIALLKEKRQAVISHAVTKGLNPDAPMKDSGIEWLGAIPKHWDVGPLKRFAEVIDCKHHTVQFLDEGLPIASIRELRNDRIDLNDAKLTSQDEWDFLREGRVPQHGDLIFCRNASVGAVGYVDFDEPFCMGQDVCLIRPDSVSRFMHFQLTSPLIRNQIEALLIGATIRRANVEEIRGLLVVHPSIEDQEAIAEFLENKLKQFDSLSDDAAAAIEFLRERRSALISAAVTGKIKVTDIPEGSHA